MRVADYARLCALGAIWGASFIFMRVAAPALGPAATAEGRMAIGAASLALWFAWTGYDARWRAHLGFYVLVGLVNSAIPFFLYGFAAMHLPASAMAILNASSPMFGLLLGALFAGERVSGRKVFGLALGSAGVAVVAGPSSLGADATLGWAVAACIGASFFYGLTGVLVKRMGAGVPAGGMAVATQAWAALLLLPLVFLIPPRAEALSPLVLGNLAGLGILASGIAFLLYFRLIADVGATRALTVTYLVPVFAVLWGSIFLGESPTLALATGGALVLAGTLLVTRG